MAAPYHATAAKFKEIEARLRHIEKTIEEMLEKAAFYGVTLE